MLADAIRSRRTHKVYGSEPVPAETLAELFELARWAPNHRLTEPWRFRHIGPLALAALKAASDPQSAAKLDRAPTLVAASVRQDGGSVRRLEDLCAASAAIYIVLLAADAHGLAGYWRTPEVLPRRPGERRRGSPRTSSSWASSTSVRAARTCRPRSAPSRRSATYPDSAPS